jgi:hypothetical protein
MTTERRRSLRRTGPRARGRIQQNTAGSPPPPFGKKAAAVQNVVPDCGGNTSSLHGPAWNRAGRPNPMTRPPRVWGGGSERTGPGSRRSCRLPSILNGLHTDSKSFSLDSQPASASSGPVSHPTGGRSYPGRPGLRGDGQRTKDTGQRTEAVLRRASRRAREEIRDSRKREPDHRSIASPRDRSSPARCFRIATLRRRPCHPPSALTPLPSVLRPLSSVLCPPSFVL